MLRERSCAAPRYRVLAVARYESHKTALDAAKAWHCALTRLHVSDPCACARVARDGPSGCVLCLDLSALRSGDGAFYRAIARSWNVVHGSR